MAGLAAVCRAGVSLLDALGKDIILVETVGVGQTELDILGVADIVTVVLVPEAGDTVQAMKAGLLEIADIFVVNKADRDGAGQMASALRAMLSLDPRPNELKPRLLMTQAHLGQGIPELYSETRRLLRDMRESGRLAERRERQAIAEVTRLVTSSVSAKVERAMSEDRALKKTVGRGEVRRPRSLHRRGTYRSLALAPIDAIRRHKPPSPSTAGKSPFPLDGGRLGWG